MRLRAGGQVMDGGGLRGGSVVPCRELEIDKATMGILLPSGVSECMQYSSRVREQEGKSWWPD